jgi:hypothetical protein
MRTTEKIGTVSHWVRIRTCDLQIYNKWNTKEATNKQEPSSVNAEAAGSNPVWGIYIVS